MQRRNFLRGSAAAAGAGLLGAAGAPAAQGSTRSTPGSAPRKSYRVQIVMFDGVEEQDFIAPYEVFGLAGAVRDVEVTYVRLDGPGTVKAHHGTRLHVQNGWAPERADLLVVPGGGAPGGPDGPATGVSAEIAKGRLPRALAAAQRRGLTIASVCSGALLLGAAGLVRGRPCVTHRGRIPELEKFGGIIKQARVVDDGSLVTAGGITCGLDLGIWMVRREFGADDTLELERVLEYELRGAVWTR